MMDQVFQSNLLARLRDEQRERWAKSDCVTAEEFLRRHPELAADVEAVLELVLAEVVLREELGETARLEEYITRFPQFQTELRRIFEVHAVVGTPGSLVADLQRADTDRRGAAIAAEQPTDAGPPGATQTEHTASCAETPLVPGFDILRELGRGGMGVVYLARQVKLDRLVALKMLLTGPQSPTQHALRFSEEARMAAEFQHPNIVTIHEFGEYNGQQYFSMDYVDGPSLASLVREHPLPAKQAAELVKTLAEAIEYAHSKNVLHRDLKPSNVLLQKRPETTGQKSVEMTNTDAPVTDICSPSARYSPRITDFGLAKRIQGGSDLTATGQVLGTPSYMPPEQASANRGELGPSSDVYSLGAILYHLVAGRPPFQADNPVDTVLQVLELEPISPRRLNPKVDRDLETICLKCLQKDRHKRYASAQELADDLQRFLGGEPILARPAGAAERAWKLVRRRPAEAMAVALGAVILLGSVGGIWWSNVRTARALTNREHELEEQHTEQLAAKQTLLEKEQQLAKQAQVQHTEQMAVQQALTEREGQLKERERTNRETSQQREGIEMARRLLAQYQYSKAEESIGRVPVSRRGWEFERLAFEVAINKRPAHYVGHHDWGIVDSVKSNDDGTIVSSGHDGRVIAWRADGAGKTELERGIWLEEGQMWRPALVRFAGEEAGIPRPDCFLKLCWLRDSETVAGASFRGKVVEWNLKPPARQEIYQHDNPLTSIAASSDEELLILGDSKGELIFRRGKGGDWRKFMLGDSANVDVVVLSAERCVVAQQSGRIVLVDLAKEQVLSDLKGPGPVWDLDLSRDRRQLAVARARASVTTLFVDNNKLLAGSAYLTPTLDVKEALDIHAVRFSPNGEQIMAGDQSGRLLIWEVGNPTPIRVFNDQQSAQLNPESLSVYPLFMRRRFADVAFSSDGATAVTGGLDTVIKRRSLAKPEGLTVLQVGDYPKVVFDPADPEMLWVGTADGKLTLWETWARKDCCRVAAHEGPVTGIAIRSRSKAGEFAAVTCGEDRSIRFWRRTGREIEREVRSIQSDEPLRSVAISPDGGRVAGYDAKDHVHLWDVETGDLIRRISMRHPHDRDSPTVGGLVSFNADGTVLAAAGPSQSLWLLSGESLEIQEQHSGDVVSGGGGTAVTWHPRDPRSLWVGDTQGRLCHYPDPKFTWVYEYLRSPVIGFSVSPDTRRVAWASSDGVVQIIDPEWLGITHTLQSPYADQQKLKATTMSFDPTGRRLLLAHQTGEIVVWETGPRTVDVNLPIEATGKWEPKTLLDGEKGRGLVLRAESVCLDQDDRLCVLYSCVERDQAREAESERRIVVLGRETEAEFSEERIEDDAGLEETPRRESFVRSMTLLCSNGELLAAYRNAPELTTAGQIVLIRKPAHPEAAGADRGSNEPPTETLFDASANWGFDLHLFASGDGKPASLHYSHLTNDLMATHWVDGAWSTIKVGHHGDGYRHSAVQSSDGRWHIVTGASRFGRDPLPLTYLVLNSTTFDEEAREIVDPVLGSGGGSIVMTPDAQPAVLYARPDSQGQMELVVARRGNSSWTQTVVRKMEGIDSYSTLACGKNGTLYFSYVDARTSNVCLAKGIEGSWSMEPVGQLLPHASQQPDVRIVTLVDKSDRPVVLVSQSSQERGSLQVFRSTKH